MLTVKKFLCSSLGQKYLMATTGLALIGFVFFHLLGNLTLLLPESETFNIYANTLESLGGALYVAEIGLLVIFITHLVTAISMKRMNRAARPVAYEGSVKTKGGEGNRNNLSSKSMIITGIILFLFLILHIWHLKFGPNVAEGYVTAIEGESVRDLFRLVKETLSNPVFALIYMISMAALGFHLRHAIWSAFQSLGMLSDRNSSSLYKIALIVALVLGGGFFLIPLWFLLGMGA